MTSDFELGVAGARGACSVGRCGGAALWWEVARAYQNGCQGCYARARRPSWSHRRGIWLTTFARQRGPPRPARVAEGGG